jgi:hypothetical protein
MFYVAYTSRASADERLSKEFEGQAKGKEASSWLF